jgi:hypothetical protein
MNLKALCLGLALTLSLPAQEAPEPAAATNAAPAGANAAPSREATRDLVDAESRELRPGDTFRFRVDEDPVTGFESMQVMVTAAGDAHFKVSRGTDIYVTVNVRNKKLPEVRQELKRLLDAEYYESSTVDLDLDNVNRGTGAGAIAEGAAKVQVYGAMQAVLPIEEGKTMLSDVILSLGRNNFAKLSKVKVHRLDPVTKKPTTQTVNVERILKNNDRTADIPLRDADRIEVPERGVIF